MLHYVSQLLLQLGEHIISSNQWAASNSYMCHFGVKALNCQCKPPPIGFSFAVATEEALCYVGRGNLDVSVATWWAVALEIYFDFAGGEINFSRVKTQRFWSCFF